VQALIIKGFVRGGCHLTSCEMNLNPTVPYTQPTKVG
jgi:hypothetical protein